jgi:glycosyltransferase involved in cell wall biosynthesis
MRVAVDATSWANRRGFGRFARNAVRSLVDADDSARYVLVCDRETASREDLPRGAGTLIVDLQCVPVEAATADSQRPLRDLVRLSAAMRRTRPDVVLFPSLYTWFPVPGTPTVVGVHDLIADEHPELTLPSRGARVRWRLKRRAAIRSAARVFTVSAASREVLAAALGVDAGSLAIVPEAPDPVFGPRPQDAIESAVAPLGLSPGEPYFLYAGGISPHKGLETLLAAYGALARRSDAPRLVVVGALEDEAYLSAADHVRRLIREAELTERVLLPGYVSDETLACLYSGAVAFVSPSRSEGFGLPAVEAAVSGCAVVLSDIPAHRESMAGAALYVPVGDAASLETALARVMDDAVLRARLADAAAERVSHMTWAAAARVLRGVLREAAARG